MALDKHWFDALHASVMQDAGRRGFFHAAGALITGIALSGAGSIAEAKRKHRGHDKKVAAAKKGGKGNGGGKGDKRKRRGKKNKDKKKRKPDPSCEQVCIQEFDLFPEQIPACVQKCNDCRIRDNFCVIGSDPRKVATCCFEGDQCCQATNACCPMISVCCPGYPQTSPLPCCPTEQECCPSDSYGCCFQGQTCCPGEGCVYITRNQRNCGICGKRCPHDELCIDGECEPAPPGGCPGRTLCDGYCVDTQRDPSHCGQCRKICRDGQSCVAGRCEPEGWECCATENGPVCTYTTGANANNPWHCGECGYECPGNQSCIAGWCRCEEPTTWCSAQKRCLLGLPC